MTSNLFRFAQCKWMKGLRNRALYEERIRGAWLTPIRAQKCTWHWQLISTPTKKEALKACHRALVTTFIEHIMFHTSFKVCPPSFNVRIYTHVYPSLTFCSTSRMLNTPFEAGRLQNVIYCNMTGQRQCSEDLLALCRWLIVIIQWIMNNETPKEGLWTALSSSFCLHNNGWHSIVICGVDYIPLQAPPSRQICYPSESSDHLLSDPDEEWWSL